jgi:hypothetical protein
VGGNGKPLNPPALSNTVLVRVPAIKPPKKHGHKP